MKERKARHTPSAISRVDVWIKGHTRKKGKPINEVLDAAVKKVQELHKPSTDEGPISIKDDALFHTFGPERRGSVRGLGFGALPSKVDAQVHENEHVRKLNYKVVDLEKQVAELRAMVMQGKRQNEEASEDVACKAHTPRGTQDTNHSQRSSDLLRSTLQDNLPTSVNEIGYVTSNEAMKMSKRTGCASHRSGEAEDTFIADPSIGLSMDQSVSSFENVKCKLLHWEGTKLVVAEGQIASTDPKSKVHHVALGPICWKVWVNHIKVNVPLFRPTREMFDLQDAIGSTVAWPSNFITLD